MYLEKKLPEIFEQLNEYLIENNIIERNEKKEGFLEKIDKLVNIWNEWLIYDSKYLLGLSAMLHKPKNTFALTDGKG